MNPLEAIDAWEVPQAGVRVVGANGVLAARGQTGVRLRIASVSKLLTTYAMLVAVEEGAVALDEPAGPPGATLRHLLAHASGYGFASDAGVLAPPGTRRIYSNRGIEEAAVHLERASGLSFGGYLTEAVLEPLGMVSTDPSGSPAFGLHSTVDDLARFAAEVLAPRLIAPETLAEAVAVQFPGLVGVVPGVGRFDPCDWGLGFERNFGRPGHWAGTTVSAGTAGHFGGSGSFLWVDQVHRLGVVCLTGRDFGPWALAAWPALADAVVASFGVEPPGVQSSGVAACPAPRTDSSPG
jgi:CubicO group peptidase (beta-lactamase class C family)